MKPTVKMFVRRLELMINHVEGDNCECVCPGSRKFKVALNTPPTANIHPKRWCIICKVFMEDSALFLCPCHHYKKKGIDPIKEALKRIAKYRKENI